jgi:plastocyanin
MRASTASQPMFWIVLAAMALTPPRAVPRGAGVTGRVTLVERGNKPANDVAQAVLWLESRTLKGGVTPTSATVLTEGKEFRPRVTVVTAGSSVRFPNNDPFNHNVFSLSREGDFDLGLYGRGEAKSTKFNRPGVIRVYCNVHATMAAFILVRDNPYFTQAGGDGSFSITGVPPGKYVLHAWHERAREITKDVEVGVEGVPDIDLQLDARGYKFVEHLNKYGEPYSVGGARY